MLGRIEDALQMRRAVYSGCLKVDGKENERTLIAANNLASSLLGLERFEEARSLLRKTMPVARRALGACNEATLGMRINLARAVYDDPSATVGDLREAVRTVEETDRDVRRGLGDAHPLATTIEPDLREAQAALDAREE